MNVKEAKQRVQEMMPDMVDNFGWKEISYLDYRENSGDPDTADRLFAEFKKYRDKHNAYAKELQRLKSIINDNKWVDSVIDNARNK